MNKVKVLIVDDSILFRKLLSDNLSKIEQIEIVATSHNAIDARAKIDQLKPDVITMDAEMPGVNGIEFIREIMKTNPIPVVMITSLNINAIEALGAGAIEFIRKPSMSGTTRDFYLEVARKILIASKAKVMKPNAKKYCSPHNGLHPLQDKQFQTKMIAIGASTGGTEAILSVVRNLPPYTPGIVIVQHMPPGFTQMFAKRLDGICQMKVKEAQDGDKVECGQILISPGDMHMTVMKSGSGYIVKCKAGEKVSGHCPSVDVLFNSVASCVGNNSVGIILTGMGRDGASGLLQMKNKGAYTLGQDKESSVVYGMPMVANNVGAVCLETSLEEIPNKLIDYLNKKEN